ncbi:MAG: ATP-binding protein [Thermoleophilaceae bacterium]
MTLVGLGSIRRSLAAGPEAPRAARRAVEFLAGYLDDDLLETSRLVVTELVTNSLRHASLTQDQRIELSVSLRRECLRIEVTDDGPGFVPHTPELGPEQRSGWGLWLVDQLSDRWEVDRPHSTIWCELDRRAG